MGLWKSQSYRERHYIFDFFKITALWIVGLKGLFFRKNNWSCAINRFLVNFLLVSVQVLLTGERSELPTKVTLNPVTKEIVRYLEVLGLKFNNAVARAVVGLFNICLNWLLKFSFVAGEEQRFIFLCFWGILAFLKLCFGISAPLKQFLFEYFDLVSIQLQRVFYTLWSEVLFIDWWDGLSGFVYLPFLSCLIVLVHHFLFWINFNSILSFIFDK